MRRGAKVAVGLAVGLLVAGLYLLLRPLLEALGRAVFGVEREP